MKAFFKEFGLLAVLVIIMMASIGKAAYNADQYTDEFDSVLNLTSEVGNADNQETNNEVMKNALTFYEYFKPFIDFGYYFHWIPFLEILYILVVVEFLRYVIDAFKLFLFALKSIELGLRKLISRWILR